MLLLTEAAVWLHVKLMKGGKGKLNLAVVVSHLGELEIGTLDGLGWESKSASRSIALCLLDGNERAGEHCSIEWVNQREAPIVQSHRLSVKLLRGKK